MYWSREEFLYFCCCFLFSIHFEHRYLIVSVLNQLQNSSAISCIYVAFVFLLCLFHVMAHNNVQTLFFVLFKKKKENHSVPKLKATLAQKVELYKCLVETLTC